MQLQQLSKNPHLKLYFQTIFHNYDFLIKGLDVSAISFHKMLQVAFKMNAINDFGSVLALTYIAAQRTFPDYNDMAENKSFLESIDDFLITRSTFF